MITYHFIYDLKLVGFVTWKVGKGSDIAYLAHITVFLFLFCVGTALYIVHSQQIRWKKWAWRSAQLAFFAGVVSLVTYIFFPTKWIFFGTLHCILLCNIVGLAFVRVPWLALLLAVVIFAWDQWGGGAIWWRLGPSLDYIPFLPWFAVTLLGIASARTNWYTKPVSFLERNVNSKIIRILKWMGTHSLWIYLIHQPILFGLLMGIKKLLG
jgi:uncharacterized membrane protein